ALFGWVWHNGTGYHQFSFERPKGVTAVPGFNTGSTSLPHTQELPVPTVPFALADFGQRAHFLGHLPGVSQAQILQFNNTSSSPTDLKVLSELKQLQQLDVWNTRLNDESLKALAGLTQLQTLNLPGNPITNAGLKELAGLTQLRALNIEGTGISDAGL